MEQYVIKGGNPLVGEVEIGGAKNAALAILAAATMTDETVTIENLPDVRDTNVLMQAMEEIGVHIDRIDRHTVKINPCPKPALPTAIWCWRRTGPSGKPWNRRTRSMIPSRKISFSLFLAVLGMVSSGFRPLPALAREDAAKISHARKSWPTM